MQQENKTISISVLDAPMGTGKALSMDSVLYTEEGEILMKDIKVGDRVYGEDGKTHSVLGVFPQGERDCYKMTFSDGTEVISSDDHIWTVQTPYDISKGRYRNFTTKELLGESLFQQTKHFKNWKIWMPLVSELTMPKREVTFDPYILGLLIGDGSLSQGVVLSNIENDIRDRVENYCSSLGDEFRRGRIDCRISGSNVRRQLRKYGLLGTRSWEKFIPEDFKINSIEVRLSVLRGLIDSDGFCSGTGYEYTTSSKQLARDVEWLVRSLGGYCSVVEREVGYKKFSGGFC